ncbi:MAG: hypothetical protein ABIS07_06780 [Dokdonella sp.]
MSALRAPTLRGLAGGFVSCAGVACVAGALLHLAIALGGPEWYAFFGAPKGIVAMARAGNVRAPISCVAIAAILSVFAAYAFSATGVIRQLPFLRVGVTFIAAILILRGVLFAPILLWQPHLLAGICDCRTIDTFIVVSSLICLGIGVGFAVAAAALARSRASAR